MGTTRTRRRYSTAAISALTALALAACGGGGGGDTAAGAGGQIALAPAPEDTPANSPAPAPAPASAPTASASAEFVVNAGAGGTRTDLARLNGGGHVVVWMAARTVCTQRYQADGAPAGAETCSGTNVVSRIRGPSVAALADGGYVVAWSASSDGSSLPKLILAQRYDANGIAVGSAQQANEITADDVADVNAAGLAGGGYVLAWTRGASTRSVEVRRYGADGLPRGSQETVNTGGDSGIADVRGIAALSGGGFVITRSDQFGGLFATRYDSQGTQLGAEFSLPAMGPGGSAIASLSAGGFAIGGRTPGSDGLVVQRFAGDGSPVGTPMSVDAPVPTLTCFSKGSPGGSPCSTFQEEVAIAGLDDGGYVATWMADPQSASLGDPKIFARRFAVDGTPAGPVIQISSGIGFDPSIATLPGGIVAITWDLISAGEVFERRIDVQSMLGGTTP